MPASTLTQLRRFLILLFLGGVGGTIVDLLLSGHYESPTQLIPLGMLAIGLVVPAGFLFRHGKATFRMMQGAMLAFVAVAFLGMFLHVRAKVEFVLERHPDMKGIELLLEATKGSSPPILAPGAMIGLGLIGLAWTWRHPGLGAGAGEHSQGEMG